jgi:hypothetical protein
LFLILILAHFCRDGSTGKSSPPSYGYGVHQEFVIVADDEQPAGPANELPAGPPAVDNSPSSVGTAMQTGGSAHRQGVSVTTQQPGRNSVSSRTLRSSSIASPLSGTTFQEVTSVRISTNVVGSPNYSNPTPGTSSSNSGSSRNLSFQFSNASVNNTPPSSCSTNPTSSPICIDSDSSDEDAAVERKRVRESNIKIIKQTNSFKKKLLLKRQNQEPGYKFCMKCVRKLKLKRFGCSSCHLEFDVYDTLYEQKVQFSL